MKTKTIIAILISLLLTFINIFAQSKIQGRLLENGWEDILPIKSTRSEVEKKLGVPKKNSEHYYLYETEEAVINIAYSGEPCTGKDFGEWNVPKDTVLYYSAGPKKEILVSDFNLDKKRFRRAVPRFNGDNVNYYSSEDNISINAILRDNNKEVIASIFYDPAKKYNSLKCKKQ